MRRKPLWRARIARERIEKLLELARKEFESRPERSKEYVKLARKIGERYNVRFSKEQKRSFCKKCNQLLIPSRTSEVKIDTRKKLITIKCTNCGYIYRYPYKMRR